MGLLPRPVRGVLAGVVAFTLGFAAAVVLAAPSTGQDFLRLSMGGRHRTIAWYDSETAPAGWKVAGWVFHDAHLATVDGEISIQGVPRASAVDIGLAMDASPVLHVLVVGLLVLAGAVAAGTDSGNPLVGALGGASIVLGYLPLAVVSGVLFRWEFGGRSAGMTGTMRVGPDLLTTTLLTGLLFPLVFGVIGGVLAARIAA